MVRLITLVCLAVAFWEGCSAQEQVVPYGTANNSSSGGKINQGSCINVNINQYPYQVALTSSGSFCGGSIISNYWVLTAAHCAQGTIGGMLLRAGSSYYNSGGTTRTVIQKVVHSLYNTPQYLDNNIALLKVSSAWVFGTGINRIALPAANAAVPSGSLATATGWGPTQTGATPWPINLHLVQLTTISNAACAAVYGGVITASKLCGNTANNCACLGHSGGPLAYNNVQIGVMSFTAPAGCATYPLVFTRVAAVRAWITTIAGV